MDDLSPLNDSIRAFADHLDKSSVFDDQPCLNERCLGGGRLSADRTPPRDSPGRPFEASRSCARGKLGDVLSSF